MATNIEYEYALLKAMSEQGLDGYDKAFGMPASAAFRRRFADLIERGLVPRTAGKNVLTKAGRTLLDTFEADPTLDHAAIAETMEHERTIQRNIDASFRIRTIVLSRTDPGRFEVAMDLGRDNHDYLAIQVSYDRATFDEAQKRYPDLGGERAFFMPFVVADIERDGTTFHRVQGLLARPTRHEGEFVSRFPRVAAERFYGIRHPVHDTWIEAPSIKALFEAVAACEPPAEVDETADMTKEEIEVYMTEKAKDDRALAVPMW